MNLIRCFSLKRFTLRTFSVRTSLRQLSAMSQDVSPILSVLPIRAMVDETLKVVVENLPPASPVTLHSLHQSEDKDYWEAFGHYISDHRGIVSVADDLSFGGTYTGKEAMGLMWSLRPVKGGRTGLRLRKMNVSIPMLFNVSVYSGHVAEGFREQPPLASVLLERWYMAPGVQRIPINENRVRGTLFIPPGPGPFPGLLDMWGVGGGLLEYRSSLLASHGYASLALDYFIPSELDSSEPFHCLERAFNVVKDHPQVNPDRVGILGLSLGSLMAISLMAYSDVVKPRCCICISCSSFALRENIITKVDQNLDKIRFDENNQCIWRGIGDALMSNPEHKVDVGRINCPLLLVNGCDDWNWPSVESGDDIGETRALLRKEEHNVGHITFSHFFRSKANVKEVKIKPCVRSFTQSQLEEMMNEAGKRHLLTKVHYPDAGHLIEPPFSPHFRATNFIVSTKTQKMTMLWGGQTKPHSDAQEDSWKKTLAFLHHYLYSSTTPKVKI